MKTADTRSKQKKHLDDDAPHVDARPAADFQQLLPWAMDITNAARMVGMSKFQFRKVFLDSGRVRLIHSGKRDRIIDTAQLHRAYQQYIADAEG